MASIKKDKKTGKWYCRISYKDKEGKYRTKTKKGFTTKSEAQIVANELELKAKRKIGFEEDALVFAHYFEKWCYTYKIGQYSKSTDLKYEREIRYVAEFFGRIEITNLTRELLQEYIDFRGKDNGKDTIDKVCSKLKGCIQMAMNDGIITKDPMQHVIKKYDKKPSKKAKYMNYEESEKLANYLFKSSEERLSDAMLLIALLTGLRIGEVYGLSYTDFTPTTLKVSRGYDYNYAKSFTDCKTESSKRTIIIPNALYSFVLRYKMKQQINNKSYLFLDMRNRPRISRDALSKRLRKILSELNIESLNIHGLRHTHTSVLIYKGLDISYISKRLGHANIVETLETYAHIIDEFNQVQDTKAAEVLDNLIFASAK